MVDTTLVARSLREDIERTGYYPALVADSLGTALGSEGLLAYAVHQEATFDREELRRHITVLALTPTRLVVAHVDEHGAEDHPAHVTTASASTEAVRLEGVASVVVTRVVADPASYKPESLPTEAMLTIGWGAVSRIDLEPASCPDPECQADHGFTGSSANDDLSIRVSEAADGAAIVSQFLTFAEALSDAIAARSS